MATDQKRETILEAAIRRFAHFGVSKTTMNEIAGDLSISKALLYYYFPDKMSLYAAVLEHISDRDTERYQAELEEQKDPVRAIEHFLEFRTDFILKYYQLLEHLKTFNQSALPEPLERIIGMLRKKELDRIAAIIEKGRASGYFKTDNARKSAELYFDFLDGFRYAQLARLPNIFPEKKQFSAILRREKEFSRTFMNGLTCDR